MHRGRLRAVLVASVALAAAGCLGSSRPARFYTLAALDPRRAPALSRVDATLAVGPVEIPDYLDRRQIVTRTGANELTIADFDRWGGSLQDEITHSLVATIAARLVERNVAVSPWRSVTLAAAASSYHVVVSISRFEGVLGGSVVLSGRWELLTGSGRKAKSLALREAEVTEQIQGQGYDALVAAMQGALVRFGGEIADALVAATQAASGA